MDYSLTTALGLGFLLGLRHAMDADHVAAVSAFVSEHRSPLRSCLVGTFWGAGHTAALLLAAVATVALKLTITDAVERALETAVAVALMLLGGHVLLRALGAAHLHRHEHSHGGYAHSHVHVHVDGAAAHEHRHLLRLGRRPFLMGVLHGLAGSAALTLLAVTSIPSPLGGLLYVLVFGVGSIAGMMALSGLIGIPFIVAAGHSSAAAAVLKALAGAFSLILGLMLFWNLGAR